MNIFEKTYLNIINESASSSNPLTFTAQEANSTIKLSKVGKPIRSGLQYRLNENNDWRFYRIGTPIKLINVGDYVQFQNTNNELSTSNYDYVHFNMTGKIAASGNIQSMLNYSSSCSPYCYSGMFEDCTSLTSVPELPATTLADGCYCGMFRGCTSLINAPELPATNLAFGCYAYMFDGCINLTKAPELPAIKLAEDCYSTMFRGCISLVEAPELPAMTLAKECYFYMFEGCTSLVEAPELPATTLAKDCYKNMFYGCTSLKNNPLED